MNRSQLKAYAPKARRDFIQMVRQRADVLGLTKAEIPTPVVQGDVAVIEGRPHPRRYAELHAKLAKKIQVEGLDQFLDRVAYSWFNRFAALRFMEVNGYLSHPFRVLSNRDAVKSEPEILEHATEVALAGLDKNKVLELKLAGNKDAELYKLLLVAQCNELHAAMPFLFERVNDETELLLPDNLLHSDSVIRKMVKPDAIDEENWKQVEIVGWLYQFYISEKKDEVIGKTVKSEDIPAATQLFTPNWIVKYMVQNSLGRLWLEANPDSQLKTRVPMEFYIDPAEDNPKIEREPMSPDEITILDPACGSGHILVEAYDVLKAIYTEKGYSSKDIPRLILEKNLFGLDIDERAAQLASFALLMKARADDRNLFDTDVAHVVPNVLAIPDSSRLELQAAEIAEMFLSKDTSPSAKVPIRDSNLLFDEMGDQPSLTQDVEQSPIRNPQSAIDLTETNVTDLMELFEQGKTLGSLIRIPHGFGAVLDKLEKAVEAKRNGRQTQPSLLAANPVEILDPFVRAGRMLAQTYDCVVANPPYMGGKYYDPELKAVLNREFPKSKGDLYACFIERNCEVCKRSGYVGMITWQNWMFLPTFAELRAHLLTLQTISSLIHNGRGIFGSDFGSCTFVLRNDCFPNWNGVFKRLYEKHGSVATVDELRNRFFTSEPIYASSNDLKRIPERPIAYWTTDKLRRIFEQGTLLGEIAEPRQGMATSDNDRFMRFWHEVSSFKRGMRFETREQAKNSNRKWVPYNKGGEFRRWYGNNEYVVNWENDGSEVLAYAAELYGSPTRTIKNIAYYFRPAITWSLTSMLGFGARVRPSGFIFDVNGMSMFPPHGEMEIFLGLLNSKLSTAFLSVINPTIAFQSGDIARIPVFSSDDYSLNISNVVGKAVEMARADWDSFETSWDFKQLQIVDCGLQTESNSVEECWKGWKNLCDESLTQMQQLETENNRLFIKAYGLEDELSPEVPLEQITLARADKEKDTRRLLSYFIGCLMGRYSLDEEGLIYADAGGVGFDPSRYPTFPADDDGIVPVTDIEWFPQEATRRFESFVRTVWGESTLHENLRWIAEQLGAKAGEEPIDTIRRYFSSSFFKDHMQTYKKRPIYWLFSSGKQKAFECLVYLHRYNESTLPRMRHEYVLPLMSKIEAQIETLAGPADAYGTRSGGLIDTSGTTSERNKLTKQLEILKKKQVELAAFDEKLRHYADMRITLELDDGVKVNYGKFGDLLAEVKAITGTKE